MFIAKYEDIPGSIGAIGTKLGEHEVNIGIMQVGRDEAGGRAIMILTLDKEIPAETIKEIQSFTILFFFIYFFINRINLKKVIFYGIF